MERKVKKQSMPEITVYDNNGETFDRYTVVIQDENWPANPGRKPMLGLSSNPTHPQGLSQFCEGQEGPHLGEKIKFEDLPGNLKTHIVYRISS